MLLYNDRQNGIVITYDTVCTAIETEAGTAEVYGVKAEMFINGSPECAGKVEDAFCFYDEAECFIKLLAENGVDPCQLEDVIQDYLQSI